ncbi:hypothetical protein RMHFA_05667 [Roseomonas mucosa]|nr:hypothetical protein RMHFA_05667 [Roseomonas mucosa]
MPSPGTRPGSGPGRCADGNGAGVSPRHTPGAAPPASCPPATPGGSCRTAHRRPGLRFAVSPLTSGRPGGASPPRCAR